LENEAIDHLFLTCSIKGFHLMGKMSLKQFIGTSKSTDLWLTSVAFVLLPLFIKNQYFLHVLIMTEIWVILAVSLNLIMGYAGQVSCAHGAIYGIGAYTSAVLCMRLGFSFWISLPAATFLSMIFGFFIGFPSFRASGMYFVFATMGFGFAFYDIFNNWIEVTGGPLGLTNIPVPEPILGFTFASKSTYYYLVFIFMFFTMYLTHRLALSRWGNAFVGIREDDILAKSLGINILKYKTIAMVISSGLTGMAGVLYAHYALFIDPVSFTVYADIIMLFMIVAGGMGTFLGPIVGAVLMTVLPETLRFATEFREALFGLLLLFFLMFMPMGIYIFIKDKITKR
jgi:branched-chain amino acid transport system permease protein